MRYCSFCTATNLPTKHICIYKTEIRHLMTEWPTVWPLDKIQEKKRFIHASSQKIICFINCIAKGQVLQIYTSQAFPFLNRNTNYTFHQKSNLFVTPVQSLYHFSHVPHIIGCLYISLYTGCIHFINILFIRPLFPSVPTNQEPERSYSFKGSGL